MAGKGFETGSRDVIDELQAQIEDLQAAVVKLQNVKQPTHPIYQVGTFYSPSNPGDFPDDPVEGQIALGDDNAIWTYTKGQWWTSWRQATLLSPWVAIGGTYHTGAQYSKSLQGDPRLRGAITGGGIGDTMFNIPAAYRPLKDQKYVVVNGTIPSTLLIKANGDVVPLS